MGGAILNETIEHLRRRAPTSKFQSHHWPMWGNAKIVDYWKKQRDLYKYIHDQSVNLMNKGYTGIEISEHGQAAAGARQAWYNRGYYGTVKHNTRAVYQRYMGFYDANPTDARPVAAGGRRQEVRRVHGRRRGRPAEGEGGLRQGRIPLGRRGAEARRLRRPEQQGRQGAARRRLRADGLPGRIRSVALGLPAGRVRAAQRRAERRRHQSPRGRRCIRSKASFDEFFGLLDTYPFWFPIVTP